MIEGNLADIGREAQRRQDLAVVKDVARRLDEAAMSHSPHVVMGLTVEQLQALFRTVARLAEGT